VGDDWKGGDAQQLVSAQKSQPSDDEEEHAVGQEEDVFRLVIPQPGILLQSTVSSPRSSSQATNPKKSVSASEGIRGAAPLQGRGGGSMTLQKEREGHVTVMVGPSSQLESSSENDGQLGGTVGNTVAHVDVERNGESENLGASENDWWGNGRGHDTGKGVPLAEVGNVVRERTVRLVINDKARLFTCHDRGRMIGRSVMGKTPKHDHDGAHNCVHDGVHDGAHDLIKHAQDGVHDGVHNGAHDGVHDGVLIVLIMLLIMVLMMVFMMVLK
jgi:hypothetical protein